MSAYAQKEYSPCPTHKSTYSGEPHCVWPWKAGVNVGAASQAYHTPYSIPADGIQVPPSKLKLNTDISFLHVDVWLSHGKGDMKLYWSVG